jgi:hypothetical protein
MTALTGWNDLNALNIGDKINYENKKTKKNKTYIIESKDIDQDIGGIRIVFRLNNDKELIINHRGDVSGDLGKFMLSDNRLKRVSSGGKRRLRTQRKRSNKRKGRKSTRRSYK